MELDKEKFIKLANEESKCEGIGAISPELLQEMIHAKEIEAMQDEINKLKNNEKEWNRVCDQHLKHIAKQRKRIGKIQAEIDECKKRVNNYRLSCNELESEANKAVDMLEIVLYEYEEDMKIRHQEQIAGLIEKHRSK